MLFYFHWLDKLAATGWNLHIKSFLWSKQCDDDQNHQQQQQQQQQPNNKDAHKHTKRENSTKKGNVMENGNK